MGNYRFISAVLVLSGLLLIGCQALAGEQGLKGAALGLGGTGFNILALWGIVRLLGYSFQKGNPPKLGSIISVIAFFIKLPLFIAFGIIAQRIGGAAPTCFLAGLALVYSCLVGWALAQR
jgi:hypothetical protein